MPGKMFKVRAKDHKAWIAEGIFEELGSRKDADCILSADGEAIKANRLVLAGASPYFEVS